MITTLDYFKTLTVTQLKDILTDFNMVGLSKMRKVELANAAAVMMEGAHLDAIAYADKVEANREIVALAQNGNYLRNQGKSYNERMASRLIGYHLTNGDSLLLTLSFYSGGMNVTNYDSQEMMDRLTPKQRRRVAHKRNKQYAKLSK